MLYKVFIFSILYFIFSLQSQAQIEHKGSPPSFLKKKAIDIPFVNMPYISENKALKNNEPHSNKKKQVIGKSFTTDYTPSNSGKWTITPTGRSWQLGISSAQAKEIGLVFHDFELENGVQLFIYPADKSYYIGAFTSQNNKKHQKLATRGVNGDHIVVELFVPNHAEVPEVRIAEVRHLFTLVNKKRTAQSCHIDANCEDGLLWQLEKRAVVKYVYSDGSSTYSCSGSLVNNTKQDGTPYVLTANHCISTQAIAEGAVFHFNYEASTCQGTVPDGTFTVSASDLKATGPSAKLDFTLLEISTTPPAEYEAYYAGWNRNTTAARQATSIHHPVGDIKKISFDTDAPTTLAEPPSDWPDDPNSHWSVVWNKGATEGGSSGSPLFDENHYIVGDLSGGNASCLNLESSDHYTKFDVSWSKYSGNTSSLKPWLDPLGTAPEKLNGFTPLPAFTDINLNEIVFPKGAVRPNTTITPQVVVHNGSESSVSAFSIKVFNAGNLVHTENWTGELPSGNSELVVMSALSDLQAGELKFELSTSDANDKVDNNKKSIQLSFSEGEEISLNFPNLPDGANIAWTLRKSSGELLYKKASYTTLTAANYPFVLNTGCYYLLTEALSIPAKTAIEIVNDTDATSIASAEINSAGEFAIWHDKNTKKICINPGETSIQNISKPYTIIRNDVNKQISIQTNQNTLSRVELWSTDGKRLNTWIQVNYILLIPESLPSAPYILRILHGKNWFGEKIIVE